MNLFKGLMFLEGHFTRPDDLDDDFAPLGNRVAARQDAGTNDSPAPALGLLAHLQFLGGRPMHAGHNLDLEEPFEQLLGAHRAGRHMVGQPAANDASRDCAACG